MLCIHVANKKQDLHTQHSDRVLEFGRGPRRQAQRIIIDDPTVSRDHLQVQELPSGRLQVKNLSHRAELPLPDGTALPAGVSADIGLPCRLSIGQTSLSIELAATAMEGAAERFDKNAYLTIQAPMARRDTQAPIPGLQSLGEALSSETIASWLETVITLQRFPADSRELYDRIARALVELVGLELGIVLLQRPPGWTVAGFHAVNDRIDARYSKTLLTHVVAERRTFYQDVNSLAYQAASLMDLAAVVASPIFGLQDEVAGVLFGSRSVRGRRSGGICPLEAQIVQLLAAAVGTNLTRTVATRTRALFEQFFSPELVGELERDPKLLEGRNQDVTILVSDLRGFTSISERLAPDTTCRILRDVMEPFTERIVEQGGVIVDYAGDGILAMWNAPVAQPDHVVRACRAALAMIDELPALNERWLATVGAPLNLGIGVNSGPARVGNTGSIRRLKYGPHGFTVNFASRIQASTKQFGVPILVSQSVQETLPPSFNTRPIGPVSLAGISDEVVLYELANDAPMTLPVH
jgi:adenylate cyclase